MMGDAQRMSRGRLTLRQLTRLQPQRAVWTQPRLALVVDHVGTTRPTHLAFAVASDADVRRVAAPLARGTRDAVRQAIPDLAQDAAHIRERFRVFRIASVAIRLEQSPRERMDDLDDVPAVTRGVEMVCAADRNRAVAVPPADADAAQIWQLSAFDLVGHACDVRAEFSQARDFVAAGSRSHDYPSDTLLLIVSIDSSRNVTR